MVVIACNTATACAINELRNILAMPVVGIEPAIKPALKNLEEFDKILVLCTPLTRKYAKSLNAYHKFDEKILYYCNNHLAPLIDKNIENLDNLLLYLSAEMSFYRMQKITKLVLGCTHYSFLVPQLKSVFGNVQIFLSEESTCENAIKICEENCLSGNGEMVFKCTGKVSGKKMQMVFEKRFES